eukprot:454151-Prymnesium_polylepis.1
MGPDGRDEEQPLGSIIEGNLAHEIGIWQKQSAFLSQAVAAQTVVHGNVFFNGPRSALNFNDGFGGGDEVYHNLLLNTCRESSDHGPINLWDRVPYITTLRSGRPSIIPATRRFHHNFIIANYHAQEAIDTDDGSSYLTVDHNLLAYGANGLKAVFGGHDLVHASNLYLFVGTCLDHVHFKGHSTAFEHNECLLLDGYASDCGPDGKKPLDPHFGHVVHSNQVYSVDGSLNVC